MPDRFMLPMPLVPFIPFMPDIEPPIAFMKTRRSLAVNFFIAFWSVCRSDAVRLPMRPIPLIPFEPFIPLVPPICPPRIEPEVEPPDVPVPVWAFAVTAPTKTVALAAKTEKVKRRTMCCIAKIPF
jgi:hypothetical protein